MNFNRSRLIVDNNTVRAGIVDVADDLTLTVNDSGRMYNLADTVGHDITLPAIAAADLSVGTPGTAGCVFDFYVGQTFITSDWQIIAGDTDSMEGSLVVNGAAVTVDAADKVIFELGAENIGDWVRVVCNGSDWLVTGIGLSASSITASG